MRGFAAWLRSGLALILAIASLQASLLGALHLPELHVGDIHAGDLADLHAAGCDHDDLPDHHHTEGCVVCRILLQTRDAEAHHRPDPLGAGRYAFVRTLVDVAIPTSAVCSSAVPRAPPLSLL